MVQIYRKQWRKSVIVSFLGYLRDSLVIWLPVRRVPDFIVRLLYGYRPRFAFLVHPRAYHDCFVSLPFLEPIKFLLRRQKAYGFVSRTSPFVLNSVKTPHGVNGFVIAQLTLPEIMFERRKITLARLKKMVRFVGKIGEKGAVIGLGGWFPMISRRGAHLDKLAKSLDLVITNGHCGTLASIYLTVERIAEVNQIPISELNLAIIGVGKMGTNVARAFNGKVRGITLIDINESSLLKTKKALESANGASEITVYDSSFDEKRSMKDILSRCHIGVCATSTFRNVLKLKDMPSGFIAVDDSRPEALPRDPRNDKIILEGGLLKIKGARLDYNFGFGEDDNVFGCLGEAFLVSLDRQQTIRPTLGDVDIDNFFKVLDLCRKSGVSEGDLKSSHAYISHGEIRAALERRKPALADQ